MNKLEIISNEDRHNQLVEIYSNTYKDHGYFFKNKLKFTNSKIDFNKDSNLVLTYKDITYNITVPSNNILILEEIIKDKL